MYQSAIVITLGIILSAGWARAAQAPAAGAAQTPAASPARPAAAEPNALDAVLKDLQDKAVALKTYRVNIDYVFRQQFVDSQQRRTGVLYYAKSDKKSNLRVDFRTLQQDQEKEQKNLQQYYFDGVWLVDIDHPVKTATKRQLAEPDKPLDALSLVSKELPVLGFAQVQDLRQQFEITLLPEAPGGQPTGRTHLHLKTKPDSVYKNDYLTIDLWIDPKSGLPVQVQAVTTEQDVYEIKLTDPKVNEPLDPKLFQVDIPRGFSSSVIPLAPRTEAATPK